VEDHALAALCELPGGLAAREPAADYLARSFWIFVVHGGKISVGGRWGTAFALGESRGCGFLERRILG
jgi:hypothetical protein